MAGGRALVVGAGPVGLGAALFLARRGRPVRLVERRTEPAAESKALAVNPRTLEILAPTGLTARMLALGKRIRGARFHRRGKSAVAVGFEGLHPAYPFLLALSQATTERLLAEALEAAGGAVERGVALVGCRPVAGGVEAELQRGGGGPRETARCPWLLGADGAHSDVRRALGIDFPGRAFAREWHLADVPLRTALAEDEAHAFFLEGGGLLFLIRVVDGEPTAGPPLWRVIANRPEPLACLVEAEPAGAPAWESSFRIAHRLSATLARGGVYLAGDAAHVHSPVGARGMNLGLEDAWVFAQLERTGRLADYERLRRPVDARVLRRVELLSKVAAAETPLHAFVRRCAFPVATRLAFVRERMRRAVTGLDHPLEPPLESG